MFSCSNGSEVVSNEQSNEAFDQILEEATKLKRKCKSLKALLLETETKRSEEGYAFEKSISNLKQELEETVSQLKAQNHIELCQMRDYRTNEVEELAKQLYAARNEIAMQEPLITTMTNKINSLENQMDSVLQYHKSEMDILKLDAKMQYDNYVREKDNDNQYHDEQQNILLNRAISAESELERLKSQNLVQLVDTMQNSIQEKDETIATLKFEKQSITCKLADSEEELTKIKEFADMLRSEKLKVADSIVYYQEENKRLDRQVELISADLDVANQKIARLQKSASNSNGNNSVNKTINGYYPHHMRTPMGSREGYNNSLYGGVGTSSSRGSMYSPRDSVTTTTTEVGEGMKSSIRKQIEQQSKGYTLLKICKYVNMYIVL